MKAQAKKTALDHLEKFEPNAITRTEASEGRAEALLLEADAKLAEAKVLELEELLKSTGAGQQQSDASAEAVPDQEKLRRSQALVELRDRLGRQLDEKSEEAAKLEMHQLEKTLLQREVEQLHGMLIQLRLPPSKEGSEEENRKKNELQDILEDRFGSLTNELESVVLRAAKTSAEVQQREIEVARSQRHIDELQRRQFPAEFVPIQPTTDHFQQAVMQDLDYLRREVGKLQTENAELKKQLEERTRPTERPQAPGSQIPPR